MPDGLCVGPALGIEDAVWLGLLGAETWDSVSCRIRRLEGYAWGREYSLTRRVPLEALVCADDPFEQGCAASGVVWGTAHGRALTRLPGWHSARSSPPAARVALTILTDSYKLRQENVLRVWPVPRAIDSDRPGFGGRPVSGLTAATAGDMSVSFAWPSAEWPSAERHGNKATDWQFSREAADAIPYKH